MSAFLSGLSFGVLIGMGIFIAGWWFKHRHERVLKQTVIEDLTADAEHHRRIAAVYQGLAGELEQTALLLSSGRAGYSPLAGRVDITAPAGVDVKELARLLEPLNRDGVRITRVPCYALQMSDQMSCPCGLTWDVNDPAPLSCIGRTVPGA